MLGRSPLRAAARRLFYIAIHQVSLLAHRHCRTPPAHRGTAMAPWNGPYNTHICIAPYGRNFRGAVARECAS